jgi:paraquat-inducible protein B
MSKPANKTLIGGFALGATALVVAAVVFFGSGKMFSETVPIVFYFEGSVKGLDVGAPLMIRGVKVGGVTSVQVVFDAKNMSTIIPVHAEFDPEKVVRVGEVKYHTWERGAKVKRLVEHGLRGQLQIQSIVTGQLMVNLDFMPYTEARLVSKGPKEIEIPTVPTVLEEVSQKLAKIPVDKVIDQATSSLEGFQKIITSPGLQSGAQDMGPTLDELKKLTISVNEEFKPFMKDTRKLMNNVDQLVVKVDRRFDPLVSKVEGALDDVGPMVSDLKKILAKTDGTLDATRKLVDQVNGELGPLTADLKKTLAEAHSAMARAKQTIEAAENNFFEGSEFYQTMTGTLQQANEAARSAQLLIEYLQRHPNAVIWGKKGQEVKER